MLQLTVLMHVSPPDDDVLSRAVVVKNAVRDVHDVSQECSVGQDLNRRQDGAIFCIHSHNDECRHYCWSGP
jgi:hypothetical protein